MSVSRDISGLFKWFGGAPESYQEMPRDDIRFADEPAQFVEPVRSPVAPDTTPPLPPLCNLAAMPAPSNAGEGASDVWSAQGLQGRLARLRGEATPQPSAAVPSRIVAVVSAKGGVGKTTLSANFAVALQRQGHSVLAFDLDPQNALQHHFKLTQAMTSGLAESSLRDWRERCVSSESGVLLLPYGDVSEEQRLQFEQQLIDEPDYLARRLAAMHLPSASVVMLDTPPGPSVYLRQALSVATDVLVVTLTDAASYTALSKIEGLIKTYAQARQQAPDVSFLINQVDESRQLSREIKQIYQELLGTQILGTVSQDEAISHALACNCNALEYAPDGVGSQDILGCSRVLQRRFAATLQAV
ncbi:Cellulose synthase operon protein YhjQ [Pseudomonas sp. 8Z]|uniref:cellulose biosynthesis protein BcsQ n=1 Tax=Pseudomonas sp. 8Z TaxID=2653166 RepID=UPI0012F1B12B|nr:cellulose biosynthesis protein BcsQ [Pseudomonas sp. 8Z]VXC43953.1 Cellulose synthase operon protein YhjQ [Pseudomonas sp. 8Z]